MSDSCRRLVFLQAALNVAQTFKKAAAEFIQQPLFMAWGKWGSPQPR